VTNHLTPEVVGIITTVVVGIIIRLIDHYVPSLRGRIVYDGTVRVVETPDKKTYSIDLGDQDPEQVMEGKDEVHLKVEHENGE
jgi:hypothetical protein